LKTLQHRDIGLLHFSCHNAFTAGTPNASRILLGNQPFEPVFLEAHAGRFVDPLVFLNACRTDGQAPLYTTVEGWASSFLRAGAGAFIGSLWEVVDTSASTYAQEFYRAALAGYSLGESTRQARDAIRDNPGDPTWLAYTFYGDPAATVNAQA
jgi:CHAT domain-containing protein